MGNWKCYFSSPLSQVLVMEEKEKKKTRAEHTLELRKPHEEVLLSLGAGKFQFFAKMHYWSSELKVRVIQMFPEEIVRLMGKDAYFVFTDKEYNLEPGPDDEPVDTLWKWIFDSTWKKYPKKGEMYLIPIGNLKIVKAEAQTTLNLSEEFTKIEENDLRNRLREIANKSIGSRCPNPQAKLVDMTVGDLECLLVNVINKIKQIRDE